MKVCTNLSLIAAICAATGANFVHADKCSDLVNHPPSNTIVTSAQLVAATSSVAEYCHVAGAINQRTSAADGQQYAIKFDLKLPTTWNGKFFYAGGAGSDGDLSVVTAGVGSPTIDAALNQNYATVASDGGHDNKTNTSTIAAQYEFGMDQQARLDYGYNGPAQTVVAAKALVKSFYGQAPSRSYFVGCSEGGREGLMFSQRYPSYFDGVLAGDPGMDLPKAVIASAYNSQSMARAVRSTTTFGNPDLQTAFTDDELKAVSNAILNKCDALDGANDGMVLKPESCTFDPATLGPNGNGTLTAKQVTALKQVFAGAKNSFGAALYSDWYWDPGIAAFGWRQWVLGPVQPNFPLPGNSALNLTLSGGTLAFVFTTPPNSSTAGTDVAPANPGITNSSPLGSGTATFGDAYVPWLMSFNMDKDAPKINATTQTYSTSPSSFMGTSGTDYATFKNRGSKLLVFHGQADPIFSAKYTVGWYKRLQMANGGAASTLNFARVFLVPGMNHCSGGPATAQFDAFSALVNWVENGKAPSSITATARSDTPWPGRTRPLCPYPQTAQFKSGNIESAASFSCQ